MKKRNYLIFIVLFSIIGSMGAIEKSEEDLNFQMWSTIAGAGFGLALDSFYVYALTEDFDPETDRIMVPTIIATTSVIQAGTTALSGWLISEGILRWEPGFWSSVLIGPAAGAVMGAVGMGLPFGVMFGMAVPSGVITLSEEMAPGADSFGEGFVFGFKGGAMTGVITGALAGLVAVPLLQYLHSRQDRDPVE